MRTISKYSDEDLLTLWELWNSCPWLKTVPENLEYLFSAFTAEDHRALIKNFLREFTYINKYQTAQLISSMASRIESHKKIDRENTYLVPRSNGRAADGSQKLLYDLVMGLGDYGWEHGNSIKFRDVIESPRDNIVVVDDFVGSGKSMIDTLNYFRAELGKAGRDDVNISAFCIAGMEIAKDRLIDAGYIEVEFEITLQAAIGQKSSTPESDNATLVSMQEGTLKSKVRGMKLKDYHLGYANAEALYYSADYRIPNSVFPLFWWGELRDSNPKWEPLFRGR